jgi:hypothetical protein
VYQDTRGELLSFRWIKRGSKRAQVASSAMMRSFRHRLQSTMRFIHLRNSRWMILLAVCMSIGGTLTLCVVGIRSAYRVDQLGVRVLTASKSSDNDLLDEYSLVVCAGHVEVVVRQFDGPALSTITHPRATLPQGWFWSSWPPVDDDTVELSRQGGFLGFAAHHRTLEDSPAFINMYILVLPMWSLFVPLIVAPSLWFGHRLRRRRRIASGRCPDCGYDLRASPGVCPECGLRLSMCR